MRVILASASPRRREILASLGVDFEVIVANADESIEEIDPITKKKRTNGEMVCEISKKKALAVYEQFSDKSEELVIIAADTVVCSEGEILGKPTDKEDARRMLEGYSGKTHSVISACTVITSKDGTAPSINSFFEESLVTFKQMSDLEIEFYLNTKEPYDKAGAYAVQGFASLYIDSIEGSFYNIVGLPLRKLYENYPQLFIK